MTQKKIDIVLPAAGSGKRMGAAQNKLFIELAGVPLILRTLKALDAIDAVERMILAVKPDEEDILLGLIEKAGVNKKKLCFVAGGAERPDSVNNGLRWLVENSPNEIVMVHDAARPFVDKALIDRLVNGLFRACCSVPTISVTDTTRILHPDETTEVLDREQLHLSQTPQAFHSKYIEEVFLNAPPSAKFTDEASYFEAANKKVALVQGNRHNLKLTQPQDLAFAAFLLQNHPELEN